MSEERSRSDGASRAGGPLRSVWLWVGVAVTVLGLALWIYARSTAAAPGPAPSNAPAAGAAARSTPGPAAPAGLLPGGVDGAAPAALTGAELEERAVRLIDEAGPATARLGVSFLVGFGLGWLLRKVITIAAVILAVVVIGVFFLASQGHLPQKGMPVDEAKVRGMADNLVAWLRAQGSSLRAFAFGYVPSAGAAAVGLLAGFRR